MHQCPGTGRSVEIGWALDGAQETEEAGSSQVDLDDDELVPPIARFASAPATSMRPEPSWMREVVGPERIAEDEEDCCLGSAMNPSRQSTSPERVHGAEDRRDDVGRVAHALGGQSEESEATGREAEDVEPRAVGAPCRADPSGQDCSCSRSREDRSCALSASDGSDGDRADESDTLGGPDPQRARAVSAPAAARQSESGGAEDAADGDSGQDSQEDLARIAERMDLPSSAPAQLPRSRPLPGLDMRPCERRLGALGEEDADPAELADEALGGLAFAYFERSDARRGDPATCALNTGGLNLRSGLEDADSGSDEVALSNMSPLPLADIGSTPDLMFDQHYMQRVLQSWNEAHRPLLGATAPGLGALSAGARSVPSPSAARGVALPLGLQGSANLGALADGARERTSGEGPALLGKGTPPLWRP